MPKYEQLRKKGQRLWFEYHCNESSESPDAPAWYHSHQQVTILKATIGDAEGVYSFKKRIYCGVSIMYKVQFDDGLEWDAFEDELDEDKSNWHRPDPPKSPKEITRR